jgi:hypothetical protein
MKRSVPLSVSGEASECKGCVCRLLQCLLRLIHSAVAARIRWVLSGGECAVSASRWKEGLNDAPV